VTALFRALEKDAARAAGRVIVLMGNHEAEFLADPTDDDNEAQAFLKERHRGLPASPAIRGARERLVFRVVGATVPSQWNTSPARSGWPISLV
jgi:hypothetical protein